METVDVAITFGESGHAGDRRRRAQSGSLDQTFKQELSFEVNYCWKVVAATCQSHRFVSRSTANPLYHVTSVFSSQAVADPPHVFNYCGQRPHAVMKTHFFLFSGVLSYSAIHKSWAFSKSKVGLGTCGPLARSRVMDLWSDDPEKPASPPARATRCIIAFKLQNL